METYIVIAKKNSAGKFEDHRVLKSGESIPTGYEKISGPAPLDDCVRQIKEAGGPNWFGLTVAQYILIGVVTVTFVVIVVIGALKLSGMETAKLGAPRTAEDGARVLITFLVAVATIAIAFLAILTAMLLREYEKRFALAKEVLTILVGILGTIVGFYFGTAKIDSANGERPPANNSSEQNGSGNAAGNGNGSSGSGSGTGTNGNRNSTTPAANQSPSASLRQREDGRYVLIVGRAEDRG
jgi:hypothetical protein